MVAVSEFTTQLLLDGEWAPGGAGTFTSINPATGNALVEVSSADASDVDTAVAAATRALHGEWAAVPPSVKGQLLNKLADLVERDAEILATLESLDMGGLPGMAHAMYIPNLAGSLRYYAGWTDKL